MGTIPFTDRIRNDITRRKAQLSKELNSAGQYFPKDDVLDVPKFWKIELEGITS